MYLFMDAPSLHCCTWAFSSCGRQGLLSVVVHRLLIVVASLARGLRISLPAEGTPVRSLVGEDPTCHRATKPMHHNCWAHALTPLVHFHPPFASASAGGGMGAGVLCWWQMSLLCVYTNGSGRSAPASSQGPWGNHAERFLLAAVKGERESSPGGCSLLFPSSF